MPTNSTESSLTVTVAQAARLLGIGERQAYEAIHRGEIPSVRVGQRILIPRARLEAWLNGDAA